MSLGDNRLGRAIAAISLTVPLLLAGAAAAYSLWRAGFTFDPTLHAQRVARLRAAQAALDLDAEAEANADLARKDSAPLEPACAPGECSKIPRLDSSRAAATMLKPRSGTARTPRPTSFHTCSTPRSAWRRRRKRPGGDVLAAERRFAGNALPRTIRLRPMTVVEESDEDLLQNGAEYAADGLVPLVERLGEGPWLDRLREVVSEVIARAAVPTSQGPIPSTRAETNGNLLQVVARLYPLTRDGGQLEMVERIAAWYGADVLPRNGFLPPRAWDLANDAPRDSYVKLRDHGGEVVPGLAEIYLLERLEQRDAADRMRPPLHSMLGAVIGAERIFDGLWLDHIDPTTGKLREGRPRRVVDTWGYLANAFVMADLAETGDAADPERGRRYAAEVERVMRAASRLHGYRWEQGVAARRLRRRHRVDALPAAVSSGRRRGGVDRRRDRRPARHATTRRLHRARVPRR